MWMVKVEQPTERLCRYQLEMFGQLVCGGVRHVHNDGPDKTRWFVGRLGAGIAIEEHHDLEA